MPLYFGALSKYSALFINISFSPLNDLACGPGEEIARIKLNMDLDD